MGHLSVILNDFDSLAIPACLALQCIIGLAVLRHLRFSRQTIEKSAADIRALTASSREQFLREYDSLLTELSLVLPNRVALDVGERVLDLERTILTRLAELESTASDADSRANLEEIVVRMEALEEKIIQTSSEAVTYALQTARSRVFHNDHFSDLVKAA